MLVAVDALGLESLLVSISTSRKSNKNAKVQRFKSKQATDPKALPLTNALRSFLTHGHPKVRMLLLLMPVV